MAGGDYIEKSDQYGGNRGRRRPSDKKKETEAKEEEEEEEQTGDSGKMAKAEGPTMAELHRHLNMAVVMAKTHMDFDAHYSDTSITSTSVLGVPSLLLPKLDGR